MTTRAKVILAIAMFVLVFEVLPALAALGYVWWTHGTISIALALNAVESFVIYTNERAAGVYRWIGFNEIASNLLGALSMLLINFLIFLGVTKVATKFYRNQLSLLRSVPQGGVGQ